MQTSNKLQRDSSSQQQATESNQYGIPPKTQKTVVLNLNDLAAIARNQVVVPASQPASHKRPSGKLTRAPRPAIVARRRWQAVFLQTLFSAIIGLLGLASALLLALPL